MNSRMDSNVELTLVKIRMLIFFLRESQGCHHQYRLCKDQKQPENVYYINCLGSMITNCAGCTREIKYRIAMVKAALNRILVTSTTGLGVKKNLVNR
jgi:hypothetical protein